MLSNNFNLVTRSGLRNPQQTHPVGILRLAPPRQEFTTVLSAATGRIMVLRALWNGAAGLVHRAINKKTMASGMAIRYPAVWKGRAGLLDCDVNLHLNNSSYLYAMELARWHFTGAMGILFQAVKHRRAFLVASQSMRYRRAIPPFAPYEIHTRIIFWDERWIYFLHQFQCPKTNKLYAEGLVRVTVQAPGGKLLSGSELYGEVEKDSRVLAEVPTGEMPDAVKGFLEWDAACRESMESTEAKGKEAIAKLPKQDPPKDLWTRIKREMALSSNWPFKT